MVREIEGIRLEIGCGDPWRELLAQPRHEQLVEFAQLIDRGEVSVFVERTVPLEQVRRVHDHLERDHVQGKIVLTV